MNLRLLETGTSTAFYNMGLDEAILESVSSGLALPSLRFYAWEPKAVSLGYFQGIQEELDIEACKKNGVDIIRRVTGGGAVFHDAEITYSIIIPQSHTLGSGTVLESYKLLSSGIPIGLKKLGLHAEFAPINDITVNGKKISGNAQTRKNGCILQHGTILLSVDVEAMFSLLKVPSEKMKGKLIQDVKERVSSLEIQCGQKVSYAEAFTVLKEGFAEALSVTLLQENPRTEEIERAHILANEKYSQESWNYKR